MIQDLKFAIRNISFVLALVMVPLMALAQAEVTRDDDLPQAQELLKSTETMLELGAADTELQGRRDQVEALRPALLALSSAKSVEAQALQAQLDSLGPPPADAATEPQAVTDRRAELQGLLAAANAPALAAQDALIRTDVILAEMDRRIRARDVTETLQRFPTPLWPSTWVTAGKDLASLHRQISLDLKSRWDQPNARDGLNDALPTATFLAVFAFVVLFFVRPRLSRLLLGAAAVSTSEVRKALLLTVANLTMLILPAIAAISLIVILPLLDLVPRGLPGLPPTLAGVAAILIFSNWLSVTLFLGRGAAEARDPVGQTGSAANSVARLIRLLGVVLALEFLVETLGLHSTVSDATISLLSLPIIAFSSYLLWKMAQVVLTSRTRPEARHEADVDTGLARFLARMMQVAAVASLAMAVLGYVRLARTAMLPVILTLALIGLAIFLYRASLRLISTVASRDEEHPGFEGSLLPFVIIFVLALLLSPLLAIFWGANASDVLHVGQRLTEGVVLGDIRLSLGNVVVLVVVFLIGAVLTRWIQRALRLTVLPRTRLDGGAQSALSKGLGYLGLTISALLAVSAAGLNLSSLAVVVGALSVGIGLGLQNIVSNFVSGIILLIERPIKEGDWIEVSGKTGIVRKIAVRSTRIETFDRHDVIVPNLDLISGTVTNFTLSTPTGRLKLPVGIAYGSDVEKARDILMGAMLAHAEVLQDPAPSVLFTSLGESALQLEMTCFVTEESRVSAILSDLLFSIYTGLQRAGIEIPFPQRELRLRDVDVLAKAFGAITPASSGG